MTARLTTTVAVALALAASLLASAPAIAGERWEFGASLAIDADVGQVVTESEREEREHQSSFGASLHGLVSKTSLPGYLGAGLDYRFGATSPGGFLYSFNLLPLGFGYVAGDYVMGGIFAGAGVSGITDRLAAAAQFPVETRLAFRLGKRLFLSTAARATWVLRDSRRGGSQTLPFGDELAARATVRWSRRYDLSRSGSGGDGYYLGIALQERLDSQMIMALVGYSLDVMWHRL